MKSIKYTTLAYLLAGTISMQAMLPYFESNENYCSCSVMKAPAPVITGVKLVIPDQTTQEKTVIVNTMNMNAANEQKPISLQNILDNVKKIHLERVGQRKSQRLNSDSITASHACEKAINEKLQELFAEDLKSVSKYMDTLLDKYTIDDKGQILHHVALGNHSLAGHIKPVLKHAAFIDFFSEIETYNKDKEDSSKMGSWPHRILDLFAKHIERSKPSTGLERSRIERSLHAINFECTPDTIMPLVKQIIHDKTGRECDFLGDKYFLDKTIMYSACQAFKSTYLNKSSIKRLNK